MSKLQAQMAEATDVHPSKKRGEEITNQGYMAKLAKAVGELPEKDWNALPKEAHDWYNASVDAVEAKKDLPPYPDMTPPASSRRRGSSDDGDGPYKPKVGDMVVAVTKRGKKVEGKLTEVDGTTLIVKTEDGEEELDTDRLESIAKAGEAASGDDEPPEPEVGDTVQIETKRGKTVMGNITVLEDDVVVVKDSAGEEHEFDKERIASITVKSKNSKASSGGKREGSGKAEEPKDDGGKKRTSSKDNGGVSVTVRMREIMADNLGISKDDVAKALKKQELAFKEETLGLVYNEFNKVVSMLRERNLLKK